MSLASVILGLSPNRLYQYQETLGPTAVDTGSDAQNGTISSGVNQSAYSVVPGEAADTAFGFVSAANNTVTIPTATVAGTFTIVAAINDMSAQGAGTYYNICSQSTSLGLWLKGGQIDWFAGSDHLGTALSKVPNAGLACLIAVVNTAGTLDYYVNNTKDASVATLITTSVALANSGGDNANAAGADNFVGSISHLAIWTSTALSGANLTSIFNAWTGSPAAKRTSPPEVGVQAAIVVTPGSVPPDPGVGVWLIQEVSSNINVAAGVRKVWPVTRGSIPNSFPPGVIPVEYVTLGSIPNAIPGVKQIVKVNQGMVPQ